jgi:GNAT superfamily N-acetyltransferase
VSYEVERGEYLISDDPKRLDIDAIHAFLSQESYWAAGISRQRLETAIDNSLPFGLYRDSSQVGFARVVSDFSTFAYLADVYVEETHRGQGLSKLLLAAITDHPDLGRIRRWMLGTRDAHTLYAQFGFVPLEDLGRWMELSDPNTYEAAEPQEAMAEHS